MAVEPDVASVPVPVGQLGELEVAGPVGEGVDGVVGVEVLARRRRSRR